jgi:hypothetical protein
VGQYKTVCGRGEAEQEECPVDIRPAERGCHGGQPLDVQAQQDYAAPQAAAEAFNSRIEHSVMAMITSAKHSARPLDTPIRDLNTAGLPTRSLIRMKPFTLDHG